MFILVCQIDSSNSASDLPGVRTSTFALIILSITRRWFCQEYCFSLEVLSSWGASRGDRLILLDGLLAVAIHPSRAVHYWVGRALLQILVCALLGPYNVEMIHIFVSVVLRFLLEGGTFVRIDLIGVAWRWDFERLAPSQTLPYADDGQNENKQRKCADDNNKNTFSRTLGGRFLFCDNLRNNLSSGNLRSSLSVTILVTSISLLSTACAVLSLSMVKYLFHAIPNISVLSLLRLSLLEMVY